MAGRLLPLSTYAELPQWFWEVKHRATPPLVPSVVMGNPPLVPLVPSVAVGNSLLVRLVPPSQLLVKHANVRFQMTETSYYYLEAQSNSPFRYPVQADQIAVACWRFRFLNPSLQISVLSHTSISTIIKLNFLPFAATISRVCVRLFPRWIRFSRVGSCSPTTVPIPKLKWFVLCFIISKSLLKLVHFSGLDCDSYYTPYPLPPSLFYIYYPLLWWRLLLLTLPRSYQPFWLGY